MTDNRQCTLLPDQYTQALAARYAGVDQVPLEHHVVLGYAGKHHNRIFRSLGFADGCRVTQHQFIQLAKCVGYDVLIEGRCEFLLFSINVGHKSDVAVIDVLVVVVLDLHDLLGDLKR